MATGSPRRRCQLLARRDDLRIQSVRGNIDTRIKKLRAGEFDAMVLAMAGISRAELFDPSLMHPLSPDEMLPAPGQGRWRCNAAEAIRRRGGYWANSMIRLRARPWKPNERSLPRCMATAIRRSPHGRRSTTRRFTCAVVGHRDGNPPVISARCRPRLGKVETPSPPSSSSFRHRTSPRFYFSSVGCPAPWRGPTPKYVSTSISPEGSIVTSIAPQRLVR